MKERRKDQRYRTYVQVLFRMGSASAKDNRGVVTNLSQHGAFVTTVDPALEGEFVIMHLDDQSGSSFKIRSQVVRKAYDGMAVRFVHSTQTAQQIGTMLPA